MALAQKLLFGGYDRLPTIVGNGLHFLGSKRLRWTLRKLDPEMKSIGATSKRGTGYLALSALH